MPYTFTDEDRAKILKQRKDVVAQDLLSDNPRYRSNHAVKRVIKDYSLLPWCCDRCKIDSWQNEPITLELDHIDGDAANNKISNLRLLCPNCHSLTSTYRGRSINTGKKRVSDEELIVSLKESPNVRQALIRVGLTPRGGNYTRAAKLMTAFNL
jgi:hypothetical protein